MRSCPFPQARSRGVAGALLAALLAVTLATPASGAAPAATGEQSEPRRSTSAPPPSLRSTPELPDAAYRGALPLGRPSLPETRTEREVADGVTHTTIVRGRDSRRNVYTIDVARPQTEQEARTLARALRRDGYAPRVDPVPAPMDADRDVQLWLVRVGSAADSADLAPLEAALEDDGYDPVGVVFVPWAGGPTTGPWHVHVLEIDAGVLAEGRVTPALAHGRVVGQATVPEIAADHDTVAAVNGGFFVVTEQDGTVGQLAGISMIDGTLVSEAVNGRTSLVLPADDTPLVSALSTDLTVRSEDGGQRHIDGLNRKPGLIRSCGGTGDDQPTTAPRHDFTCTNDSELIHFTAVFDSQTEPGDGAEVVLDASATVTEFRDWRGGDIPDDGSVLSATGAAVTWLEQHATPGTRLDIEYTVGSADVALPDDDALSIVNGGPRLLRGGEVDVRAATEGFDWPDDREFYYGWVFARHPRTLGGVTDTGDLLLVTVDGRGDSVGASLREGARILRSLGAEEGVNLDGGGSTLMTVEGEVVNLPSDRNPYRPVADALLVAP